MILICLGFFNFKKNTKDESLSFNNVLSKSENDLTDNITEIIRLRKDLSSTVLELQKEIENLKSDIEYLKYKDFERNNIKETNYIHANANIKIEDKSLKEDVEISTKKQEKAFDNKTNNLNPKVIEIQDLITKGLSDDEICKKIKIGRGELLLIKGLYN